ncbi:hypothetical protein CHUAL_012241 [Chamberlinius hualienensis]
MDNVSISTSKLSSKLFLRKAIYFTILFVCVSFALICKNANSGYTDQFNCADVINTKVEIREKRENSGLEPSGTTVSTNNQINSARSTLNKKLKKNKNNKNVSNVHSSTTVTIRTAEESTKVQISSTTETPKIQTEEIKSSTAADLTSKQTDIAAIINTATEETTTSVKTTVDTTTNGSIATTVTKSSGQTENIKSTKETSNLISTAPPPTSFCEPPAYHEFPDDLFTNKQRKQGFVIIHILAGLYMLFALAVVCDEYFVASMEKICSKLGLSEDVAGATFMAAGSSAPELFASLLGVFVAKGDVGTGTIVGSAVFNILFVIGFCALFAGKAVALNWWPLLRDSSYYSIAVIVLISIMADGRVTWWESLLMIIFYFIYIIIMKFNVKIRVCLTENTKLSLMDELTQSSQGILSADGKSIQSSYVQFNNTEEEQYPVTRPPRDPRSMPLDEIIRDYPRKWSLYEAALKVMHGRRFSPRTRFVCAGLRIIEEWNHVRRYGYPKSPPIIINQFDDFSNPKQMTADLQPSGDWKKAPSIADNGIFGVIRWGMTIPIYATLHYTIPNCKDPGWEKWFLLTFTFSMLWIAFFSYILVWMVTLVGYTFGIPDTIMGITFLAAGTSIPDAYSSLLVAKQGLGDMAVSNSIGSNVFDILVGLALPWFLQTAIIEPGSQVQISSGGMVYNVTLLFLSIIVTITSIHYARWQLNQRLGIWLILSYAVFLMFSILIEFNVFGYVNPPECEED